MRSLFFCSAVIAGLVSAGVQSAQADQTIFHDDFGARVNQGSIVGTSPNIQNTGGATYGIQVEDVAQANVFSNPYWGGQQMLEFTASNHFNSAYLPYAYDPTSTSDILRFEVTMRKSAGHLNNFIMGFSGTGNSGVPGGAGFLVFKQGSVEAYNSAGGGSSTPYTTWSPFSTSSFNTIAFEYNPLNVATQPWSIEIEGDKQLIVDGGNYSPITSIGGIGFGHWNSYGSGGNSSTTWLTEIKFERISQGGPPPIDGDLDGDGFVGQNDLNLILGNWGLAVPPGDPLADFNNDGQIGQDDLNAVLGTWGQGIQPPVTAVPEPASMVLFGLAGVGLVALRLRTRKVA
ncbi:MAG: PEP-CTERM sorting domain-containing protein [Planctomycetota bacterium]|nr:PEP-CTERM sorting domain-containing protein [Planctomycetota bacterium]